MTLSSPASGAINPTGPAATTLTPGASTALASMLCGWNLRHMSAGRPQSTLSIAGTWDGVYPIAAWRPFYLELPKRGHKSDVCGRMNPAFGVAMRTTNWSMPRVVQLPSYVNADANASGEPSSSEQLEQLKQLVLLIRHWDLIALPDLPCIALAAKVTGFYGEQRECQIVGVLLVWHDGASRLVTLDWTEGQLEDCVTPEWRVECSPCQCLSSLAKQLPALVSNIHLTSMQYSLAAIPGCLTHGLRGQTLPAAVPDWHREWCYSDRQAFNEDLAALVATTHALVGNQAEGLRTTHNGVRAASTTSLARDRSHPPSPVS